MKEVKVVLRKNGGFYCVYGDDTYILNYLFNYKIKDDKVGFPISAIDKVINVLEEKNINYELNNNLIDFKNKNNYKKYYKLGKKKCNIEYRINEIMNKLNSLDEKDIDKILKYIEELYE